MNHDGPVLITGGAGFIGANLADRLAADGRTVVVYDSLVREGVRRNLAWLKSRWSDRIVPVVADVRDAAALAEAAQKASAVFHFAAQVAVTGSLADPVHDFSVNLAATVRLLDALRERGEPVPVIFASTNKVYGDLGELEFEVRGDGYVPVDATCRKLGVGEGRSLDFHTPYGCSKGAADQYVLDYARAFGLPTCVLRMSCIYGRRQMGTEDQGWVAHFAIRALEGRPVTLFGDGRQVRDILDVEDTVEAYVQALNRIDQVKGRAFNLGGGPDNATSLMQVLAHIELLTGRKVELQWADWRPGDQRWYVSDSRLARRELQLRHVKPWRQGVADLVAWLADERGLDLPRVEKTWSDGDDRRLPAGAI